jgi:hypothetical protein
MFDRLIYPVTILKDLNIGSTYYTSLLFTFLGFEAVPRTQLFIIIIIVASIIVFIFYIWESIHDYPLQY